MKKFWQNKYEKDTSKWSAARLNKQKEEDQKDMLEIPKTENLINLIKCHHL